jgi:hypothetical protein
MGRGNAARMRAGRNGPDRRVKMVKFFPAPLAESVSAERASDIGANDEARSVDSEELVTAGAAPELPREPTPQKLASGLPALDRIEVVTGRRERIRSRDKLDRNGSPKGPVLRSLYACGAAS